MVGVTITDVFKQVNVPLLTPVDKEITGVSLSRPTFTTLELMEEAHPLVLLVTTTLYEPAALNTGVAVVSVPGTIPLAGLQL